MFFIVVLLIVIIFVLMVRLELKNKELNKQNFVLIKETELDEMTGLCNNETYEKRCLRLIERHKDSFGGFFFFDLDRLKELNAKNGHEVGDQLIKGFAQILEGFNDDYTITFRTSGDEFGLLRMNQSLIEAQRFKEYLDLKLNSIIELDNGKKMVVEYSGGGSIYNLDTKDFKELKKYADITMDQVKKNKAQGKMQKNILMFNRDIQKTYSKRLVTTIIKRKQLKAAFQPIFNLNDGSIIGYEGLSRPTNPKVLQITELINLVKREGGAYNVDEITIEQLDLLMMEQVIKKFDKEGLLFINMELKSVEAIDEYVSRINELARKSGKMMESIVIEISSDQLWSLEKLQKISKLKEEYGFLIAIDTFEFGLTNNGLRTFLTADFLKLGRSFTTMKAESASTIESLKKFISQLEAGGTKVISMGIETEEQLEFVKSVGNNFGQGFYLGVPK